MLNPGKLNRKVTVQAKAAATDTFGEPVAGWADVWSGWAMVLAITANAQRKYQAAGFTSQVTHVVTVRWRPGNPFGPGQRVVLADGRAFRVELVSNPDEGRVQFDLLCLEYSGDGDS